MKRKFILLAMMLLTLIGGVKFNVLNAQETVVEIGGNATSTSQHYPMGLYYPYTLVQQVYTSTDIANAGFSEGSGVITKIAFKINKSSATRKVTVYMKNTDKETLSDLESYSADDKVFHRDNLVITKNDGDWMTIDLDTDFNYEGGNIVVTVLDNTGSYTTWNTNLLYCEETNIKYTLYGYNSSAINEGTKPSSWYSSSKRGSIRFTIKSAEPSVKIDPESVDLGAVRLGEDFFTEKPFDYNNYAVTVKAQGGATISNITTDNDFFRIVEVYTSGQDEYIFHINYNRNAETGSKTGNLVVTYDTDKTATIPLSAVAYAATEGEAIENPIEVAFTDNAFTHAATGMHDDYILPGEENDGNNGDAVYKFTLGNDAVLTANVTGTKPIVAIYNEDFGEKEGPSSDNNYEGAENDAGHTAPTIFGPYTFDNEAGLDDFTIIDKDNDGYKWYVGNNTYIGSSCLLSDTKVGMDNHIVTKNKYLITDNSKLNFKLNSYYQEVIGVEVSENGVDYENVHEYVYGSMYSGTQDVSIDLSSCQGKEVYIAIYHKKYVNSSGYKVAIDNLELTGTATNTNQNESIDRVLYPAGTYYLVAAAEGNFTLNLSTSELSAPAAATLTAPANEATEQNNPLLTWTLDKFAEEYQLLLGTTNPPTDVVVDWSAPATSYQTEGLANNTVYYWQVKSKNSVGESSSEVFSFVTPLNKPTNVTASKTNLYPGDETTISWTEASGATSYNVYVGENKVASEVTSPYTLSSLEYNVNPGHNVTVTANHNLGESAKSDAVVVKMTAKSTVTFTVKNAAGTPVEGASVRIYNGKDQYGVAIAEQTFTTDANGQVVEDLLYLYGDYTGYYYFEVTKAPYTTYNYNSTYDYITYSYLNNPTYAKNITLQLAAPTGFVAESYNVYPEQNIVLSWNEVAEATSYKVYRRGAYSYTTYDYEYTELGETTDLTYSVETPEYNMTGVYYSLEAVYNEGVSPKATLANPVKVTGYGSFTATVNVEGATMKLEGTDEFGAAQTYEIVADENGSYAANEVLAGSYTATVSAFGYNDATATVTVAYNGEASYDFVMTEKPTAPEELLKDVAVAEEYGAAKVTWTGAYNNTQMYNIYRRNVETGVVELVAEDQNGTYSISKSYTDADYAELEDGTYQYGVTTMVEKEVDNSTSFEDGVMPDGWIIKNNTSKPESDWTIVSNSTSDGVYSAYSYAYTSTTNEVMLISPMIDLTSVQDPKVSFSYRTYSIYGSGYSNYVYVKVSTSVDGPWEQIYTNNKVYSGQEWKDGSANLNNYVGKKIYVAFCTTINYCQTYIDNIVLPASKAVSESAPVWSNTIKKGGIVFTNNNGEGDGKWETASNWSNGEVPANDGTAEVTIKAAATISSEVNVKYLAINGGSLTLESTAVLTANEIVNEDEYSFIIKDGAQLFHNSDNVKASFTMGIVNPEGEWNENNKTGWQFIASPFTEAYVSTFVPAQGNNYDLYRYAGSADKEWDNHKDNYNDQSWWYFNQGEGYLASYGELEKATLSGTLNSGLTYSWDNLTYNNSKDLANFHLLGNPFTFDMDVTAATYNNLVEGVAIVTSEGGYDYSQTTIPVGDGFFVQAIGENPSLSYGGRGARSVKSNNSLNITATGNAGEDNVIINLAGKSEGFDKLQNFNDAIATVYVAEGGKNYGIYNCDADVQEVELSFNANQMGNYTISIEPNGKFQTVTLVDRFTGIETNMLVEDYHFTAMSNVNTNRFIVRMVNGQESTDNSHFVYQSGEDLIIDAEGTVQIIDVMGRVLVSDEVESTNNRINVSGFQNGTYMVRVINGSEVKVEKVVIY